MPPAAPDMLRLAADFPRASEADWRKLVDGVLKGAPFEKLIGKTYDGVAIAPLYPRARDALPIARRAAGAPWQIMQRIDHPDAAQANAQALHDLENGATGLTLVFADSLGARGFGLPPTREALRRALQGVILDADIAIEFETGAQSWEMPSHLAELLKSQFIPLAKVIFRGGLDSVGDAARRGDIGRGDKSFAATVAQLVRDGFRTPLMVADGRIVHDAGGTEAQELAFVLGSGVMYLRALEQQGVVLDDARGMVAARLSADADQFLTMAKFRALRRLWARIEQSCGLMPKPLFVSAETSWRMLTQRDCAVNMLRATMATFAAGVAGADAVTVLPHTLALGLPDEFARRVARNTHLILMEESNLAKVGDPAAGSGAIETLTTQLCEQAWALFQEIERAGGVIAALSRNVIQRHVASARDARAKKIARRRDVMTGASEFPNLNEVAPAVLRKRDISSVTSLALGETPTFEPLQAIRLAQPFEALRDESDAMLATTGSRPKVLLVTLGTPADYTPRLTFAKSFFETGGIEAVEFNLPSPSLSSPSPPSAALAARGGEGRREASGWGATSSEDAPHPRPLPTEDGGRGEDFATLAGAFNASGAMLVCLCSSDKLYQSEAEAAARALHTAGAKHIYLAGRPGEREAALRAAGVSDFIAAGDDAVATLNAAYDRLASA